MTALQWGARPPGWIAACLALLACGNGAADATRADAAAEDAPLDRVLSVDAADAPGDSSVVASSDAGGDALVESSTVADAGPPQAMAIPMYVDPSASAASWTQVTSAAPGVSLVVANPDSGPGPAAAHSAGQTIVGYVHTSYGARPIAQVEADVDAWYSFYPAIDGVFSDETSTDATTVATYYQPLFEYVKSKSGAHIVVINPGTMIDESFMQVADVVVTFEDTYANYTGNAYPALPAWVAGYPRWRFWHLVLSAASVTDMQDAVNLARERNAGYVFVTDQPPASAYQQIPTGAYWQAELAAIQAP